MDGIGRNAGADDEAQMDWTAHGPSTLIRGIWVCGRAGGGATLARTAPLVEGTLNSSTPGLCTCVAPGPSLQPIPSRWGSCEFQRTEWNLNTVSFP